MFLRKMFYRIHRCFFSATEAFLSNHSQEIKQGIDENPLKLFSEKLVDTFTGKLEYRTSQGLSFFSFKENKIMK